jgi:hypothetical protein
MKKPLRNKTGWEWNIDIITGNNIVSLLKTQMISGLDVNG